MSTSTDAQTTDALPPQPIGYAPGFMISTIAGTLTVFLFDEPIAPLFVMILYGVFGLGTVRRGGSILQFSDSFYYLGFVLTLSSLLAATGVFSGAVPGQSTNLLQKFGQGMLTTVFGVFGRTAMLLFFRPMGMTFEEISRHIESASRRYVTQMNKLSTEAEATATALSDRVVKKVPDVVIGFENLGKSLGTADGSIVKTRETIEQLRGEFETSRTGMEALRGSVKGTVDDLKNQIDQFKTRITAAATELASLATVVSGMKGASGELSAIGGELRTLAGELKTSTASIAGVGFAKRLESLAKATDTVAQGFKQTSEQLEASAAKVTSASGAHLGRLSAADQELASAVMSVTAQLAELRDRLQKPSEPEPRRENTIAARFFQSRAR